MKKKLTAICLCVALLAIAIVGELVDVRYRQRYSEEAQARHEKSLGRE